MIQIFTLIISLLMMLFSNVSVAKKPTTLTLATHKMSLDDRYPVSSVSDVFKNNILLSIAYLENKVKNPQSIAWNDVEKPLHYSIDLAPNQTFAFHDAVLPQYAGKVTRTTNAHFDSSEGFLSDGYLIGDGVCHLASLINWSARDAGLAVVSPTNHDFANIPEVPKKYGVAIFDDPNSPDASAMQNLYVTNNKDHTVSLVFDYKNDTLSVSVVEPTKNTQDSKIASLLF